MITCHVDVRHLRLLCLLHWTGLLGYIGEHGGALCGLEVLGARLLKQSLWPGAVYVLVSSSYFGCDGDALLHSMLGFEGLQLVGGGRHDLVRGRDVLLLPARV